MLCRLQLLMLLFFLWQEDNKNYLTLVEKYGDGLLVCGTGACAPTCWNLVCGDGTRAEFLASCSLRL